MIMNTNPAVPLEEDDCKGRLLRPRLIFDTANKAVNTVPMPIPINETDASTMNSVNLKESKNKIQM